MKRFTRITRDRALQLGHVTMRYVAIDAGSTPAGETTVQFTMRWFWRYELEHLLHRAGFTHVDIFGDFRSLAREPRLTHIRDRGAVIASTPTDNSSVTERKRCR
jgi:hypothetical protein